MLLKFHVPSYPVRTISIPCSCGNYVKIKHKCEECMKFLCDSCSIHCDRCYYWICKDCEHEGCDNKRSIGCLECLDCYCSTCYPNHECN